MTVRAGVNAALAAGATAAGASLALLATGRITGLGIAVAVTGAVYVAVGLVGAAILRSQPSNTAGWVFLVSGTAAPINCLASTVALILFQEGELGAAAWVQIAAAPFAVLGTTFMATFGILLFPGRPLDTRGRRILARVYAAELAILFLWALFGTQAMTVAVPNPIGFPGADLGVLAILIMGPLSTLACVSLLRWARRDDGPHARPLRVAGWLSFGVPALYLSCVAVGMITGDTSVVSVLEDCVSLGLGLAAWVGIVRYGLFNTRAVLSRALVYGALSVVLVAVYLVTVVAVQRFLAGTPVHAAAAVATALCVLPLRDLAQRRVNRLVYGLRDDPAAALARLGERLDDAGDVLLAAARTVAEVLRLPYVAIEVGGAVLADHGRRLPGTVRTLPLPFAGEDIGHLIVQPRDDGELTPAEHRLLSELSRQVAVAAHAVTLTIALRQSRQRLVATREEERRRLRRDLHDGLGPTLAGIALGIDTARRAVPDGSPTQTLLATLREETESAVADIRRIVYALRPPILDELGLAGAIREQAVRFGAEAIDVPAGLPALPAAVEVAAYHIAMEALTNANRHAPGSPVSVSLQVNGRLELSIRDGGAGLPASHRAGVGLASMSERAEELGGTCVVRPRQPHGTEVAAEFPLDVAAGPDLPAVQEPA